MKAPLPDNEEARLRSLQLYDILDTLPEKAFDEITLLAAHICGCPIATVSIIERERQWYKSRVGMDATETPREIAFCSHTINQSELLIVPDTYRDKRFSDNPVVTGGPKVRFYAGAPLINKDGFGLGTLCVVDIKPRDLTSEQTAALEALSRHVVILLELRRAEKEVHHLNDALEQRVLERTGQLNAANNLLKFEIEEKERLQQQMVQIQKMEAIGRLAGGIAHDFNNILQVIAGYCEIMLDEPALPAPEKDSILEIQKSGNRGVSLVRQLLTFSRRQVITAKVIDLNDTMQNMAGMLRRLIGADITFEINKGENLFLIRADVNQIEQIIMNLVINAGDAMPHGGNLLVETSSMVLEKPLPHEGGEIEPDRYTILTVQDSGTGMTDEIKAKIFEPFFTTKPMGKGTGLGLATCFGIVQQSSGFIRCESEVGRGTTFQVFLPAAEANSQVSKTGRLATTSPRGQETILLVEDDGAVRQLNSLRLGNLGYTVLEAGDGLEALALVQSRSLLKIDLLLTDIVMPHLNGRELMERLSFIRPELKTILMSGYTDDSLVQRGLDGGSACFFLQKPFTSHQLGTCIREALDRGAPKH
jgi:signal transduction histidine kinase/ActR/RegA family two-component response regulator